MAPDPVPGRTTQTETAGATEPAVKPAGTSAAAKAAARAAKAAERARQSAEKAAEKLRKQEEKARQRELKLREKDEAKAKKARLAEERRNAKALAKAAAKSAAAPRAAAKGKARAKSTARGVAESAGAAAGADGVGASATPATLAQRLALKRTSFALKHSAAASKRSSTAGKRAAASAAARAHDDSAAPSAKRPRRAADACQAADVGLDVDVTEVPNGAAAESLLGGLSSIARDKAGWVAKACGLERRRVGGALRLLQAGDTIPFIARYRKEQTGSMNEEELRLVERDLHRADALESRRVRVALTLQKRELLSEELRAALLGAAVVEEVEDIWEPFRTKRQTRGQIARSRGLAPLARLIERLGGGQSARAPEIVAAGYVDEARGVPGAAEALAGARDILAEQCAHRADVKQHAREALEAFASLVSRRRSQTRDVEEQYKTYWQFDVPMSRVRPHQFLAIQRGEVAGALSVSVGLTGGAGEGFVEELVSRSRAVPTPQTSWRAPHPAWEKEWRAAITDAFKRLVRPSLEREWRRRLKERAEDDAFDTYRRNLRTKLLTPPLRMHPEWGEAANEPVGAVLGIDPAYRTGCKLALVDITGQLASSKHTGTAYPHPSWKGAKVSSDQAAAASAALKSFLNEGTRAGRVVCSIGNGTASRETEAWLREELRASSACTGDTIGYCIVDEAGASVYSASPLAGHELPELEASLRGAVSIARRLVDPLAELVKIDPQSIGVGLYQHDVDGKRLARELRGAVEDCVSAVGVDVNTASPSLLEHVAGLSAQLAQAIVAHRDSQSAFPSRAAVLNVRGLGPKAFGQAAGFLRCHGASADPLDSTAVHPESYAVARALKSRYGSRCESFPTEASAALAAELGVGEETLRDIVAALAGKAADPRAAQAPLRIKAPTSTGASSTNGGPVDAQEMGLCVEDLSTGLHLQGVVRNVVAFGAFIDIGVGNDGLLHISQYGEGLPWGANALKVNDRVEVWIQSIARQGSAAGKKERWRIGLTMRAAAAAA